MTAGLATAMVAPPASASAPDPLPASAAAVATCHGRTVTKAGTAGPDTLVGTEGADVFSAGAGDDLVIGLEGNDVACLGSGNDRFVGGPGSDTFVAEATPDGSDRFTTEGFDTAVYSARTTPVVISLDGVANDGAAGERDDIGNADVLGGAAADTLISVDASVRSQLLGGPGDDTLTGVGNLFGESGQDRLTLNGANSGIQVLGGDGNDKLTHPGSGPRAFMDGQGGADTVTGGNSGDNLFGGDGDDRIMGGEGDDTLLGDAGNDTLVGLFGNDQIGGGDGNDDLVATIEQDGSDALSGGPGVDTANYSGRNNLGVGTVLSLSLDNIRNDGEPTEGDLLFDDVEILKGGTGHNVITGNTKANILIGGQSTDQIFGADGIAGNDTITGGPGSNFCTFDAGPPSDIVAC
jgi:Ca2+-binding RTX toxin-like protein